ncbi:MAG: hypothetical protein M1836_006813 [Candelina mexicana]|nr:MAG: hypothetical protein M1836_006813 [Candelina mexicana]
MAVAPLTAVGTASAVLALSKATWKLGSSLSKLHQGTGIFGATIGNLAEEVKSLGNECDLVYAELEEIVSKSEAGSFPLYDVDGKIWKYAATQVEETSRTIQELEFFVKSVRGERSNFIVQAQRQREINDQIADIRTRVCRHTDNLRTTLLLINTVRTQVAPRRADRGLAIELQRSSEADLQSRPYHPEADRIQCARGVLVEGTTMSEAILAADSVAGGQGAANSNVRVAEWVSTLDSIRRDQRLSDPSDIVSNVPSVFSGDEAHTVVTSATSAQRAVQEREATDAVLDDSEDDLDTDLAKAALDTGTKAFEAQEWEEADSLLQEALRVLQQLTKQQRAFCDIFSLQYKLAVCAYHTQEPTDAEQALMSLVQQSASSDEQRGCICDAAHLLSHLYIRMGQVDRARSECEKALQARRRLLGKRSNASLESTALMAHIYILLNNRARAKSCLAMIPEARRDAIIEMIEQSLSAKMGHLGSPSLLSRSITAESDLDLAVKRIGSGPSTCSSASHVEDRCYGPVAALISKSHAASPQQSHEHTLSEKDDLRSVTVTSLSSAEKRNGSAAMKKGKAHEEDFVSTASSSLGGSPEMNESSKVKTLSRKEIVQRVGCQPRDRIEDAVCDGDHSSVASLLNKKSDFWRSKLRKRVRPERVTALHFAALFGELDMARQLLGSGFNINEAPFGYTTSLTPLRFAIGARQVEMVEFLVANGAKPSEPDSWSTLAGQLMNHSWLKKTLSDAEKDQVPNRIIAILRILLKQGWNINTPIEPSGRTVLHQAVAFWTGSYNWDLSLRAGVTSFLCERGADPFQANTEGKTPYDLAFASGHHELLLVLDRGLKKTGLEDGPAEPVELPTERETNTHGEYKARIEIGSRKDWIRERVKNGR